MSFDLTQKATGEGAAQYSVPVVGAANELSLGRVAGGSMADVADVNPVGGIPVVHIITVPDAQAAAINVTLTHKTRVIDVHLVKTAGAGGAGDTITVGNAGNAITNAMSVNVADTTVVRAGTIDDANHEIAAGGSLRVTPAGQPGVGCIVYVTGVRVA